jgi:hypothetical protein
MLPRVRLIISQESPMKNFVNFIIAVLACIPVAIAGAAECVIADLPAYTALQANDKLPDPFLSMNGTRITSKDEWLCRRAEIARQVEAYELGPMPPPPESVTGTVRDQTLVVTVRDKDREMSFAATIELPTTGDGPFPAMIVLGKGTGFNAKQTISGLGVAMIYVDNGVIAEQDNGGSRGKGEFYKLYPGHEAGAMMAWAFGVSRLVDALRATPAANIDASRLGITGCSRNGKGAIVVGAFDERIALTITQESGAGGSSLWRVADVHQREWIAAGQVPEYGAVQTLAQIVTENVWFRDSFRQFATTATHLPFDQHMVMGLIAPRGLLVINNTDMYWLDREGSHLGAIAAHRIWDALGVPDAMATSQRGGHPHCSGVPQPELDLVAAYVSKFLLRDDRAPTRILFTDGNFPDTADAWIEWDTPTLR